LIGKSNYKFISLLKLKFMRIFEFLKSWTFVRQLLIAIIIVGVFGFLLVVFLDFRTRHGEEINVPDLKKMKIEIAEEKLADLGVVALILDTVDYNKDFPPYSIVEQDPEAGEKVKDGRKIYVKINSGGYAMITLPDLEEKTYRQIQATFRALGLQVGEITYKPNLAKDLVLVVRQNGKTLKKGDKVLKNSIIDLDLGDGKRTFEESNLDGMLDSLQINKPEIDADVPKTEGQY
jgi:beta-lactam-binding protein with PASTA domain